MEDEQNTTASTEKTAENNDGITTNSTVVTTGGKASGALVHDQMATTAVASLKAFHEEFKLARGSSDSTAGDNNSSPIIPTAATATTDLDRTLTPANTDTSTRTTTATSTSTSTSTPDTDNNAVNNNSNGCSSSSIIAEGIPVDFGAKKKKTTKNKKKKKKKLKPMAPPSFEDTYEDTGVELGAGSFAVVRECIRKLDGLRCANKLVDKQAKRAPSRQQVFRELDILMECRGAPFIVQLFDFYETDDHFSFVFEKLEGGALLEHIERRQHFTEREASNVTRDLAEALKFLHFSGIAHRDLKPDNVLCVHHDCASPAKVCDFNLGSGSSDSGRYVRDSAGGGGGGATMVIEEDSKPLLPLLTPVGTPEYMAPEVVDALTLGQARAYDQRCDVWSLGVIVYIMLSGDPPFSGDCGITCGWREGKPCEECAENLLEEIQAGYFDFAAPAWRRVSGAAKDLIARMLVRADERITASQALQHPWLRHQEEAPQTPLLTPKRLSSAPAGPAALTEFAAEANVKNRQLGSMDETQLQFMKSGVAFLDDGSGGGDFLPLDGGRRQRATASMGLFVGGVDDLATDTKDTETTIFKNASSPCSSAATTLTTMTTSATTTLTTTTTGKTSEISTSNNPNNVLTD
eukprot:UC1_evm1s1757